MDSSKVRLAIPGSRSVAGQVLFSLALATAATAQVSFNGPQFQVNTYTTSGQRQSAVASDASGGFVVAWASEGSPGTDSDGVSVQARRYDARGIPLGDQFQVNSYTTNNQYFPAVTVDGQSGFVVVWESWGSSGTDDDVLSIHGQRFDALGTPLGGEFQVNSYTTGDQDYPGVASDALGNFVVVWRSAGSYSDPTFSIQAQRYDHDGVPLGAQFQVNSYTTDNQSYPAVTTVSQGGFVVVWRSDGSFGTDTSGSSVQARRFDASGTPLGSEFQVNSYTTNYQGYPAVAADSQGNFVVAWISDGSFGSDTSGQSIQAQRFATDGTPLGAQFQVNSYTTGNQTYPVVAADSRGGFAVVWQSPGSGGTDNDPNSVQGQQFDSLGNPLGGEFQVNSYTTGDQRLPAVAADALGDIVVVWESNGSSGTDQDGQSIQAQRFDGLFRDGFEAGDTARWSGVVP
ncbi:MAG: hypothetical protein F9K18_05290 [Thermoanaerobaculia bacterium]|nr:MAG: hypothetical protein F9K18_05290 [Thermoanaerobaculia bacterium]